MLRDIEAIPYRRRKYEKMAMMREIMMRAGPQYQKQVDTIQKHQKLRRDQRRTSIQGAWFMKDDSIANADSEWRANIVFRIAIIVSVVHLCILMVIFLRNLYGLAQKSSATVF